MQAMLDETQDYKAGAQYRDEQEAVRLYIYNISRRDIAEYNTSFSYCTVAPVAC